MHLAKADLDEIVAILAAQVPRDVEVLAFGSRVHGRNLKPRSDLDLCLRGSAALPEGLVARLKEAFAESNVSVRVDVVDWHAISEGFREAIRGETMPIARL